MRFWRLVALLALLGHLLFDAAGRRSNGDNNKKKKNLTESKDARRKEAKFLSLFSIVTFKNDPCISMSSVSSGSTSFRNGTCYTSTECTNNGGTSSGNCAAGFGVCCLFLVDSCDVTVSRNATYLRNPGFPSAYTDTTNCMYTIDKCAGDVCALRLDFESFTTNGPANSLEDNGGQCQDTLTTTTSSGFRVPVICGLNTGEHMYLDLGADSGDSATLNFQFNAAATGMRMWEIKVLQIPCNSPLLPPNGCLQFQTGVTGRYQTFNFLDTATSHLANQQYTQCVRQEEGYCCIRWEVCNNENQPFSIGANMGVVGLIESLCTLDWITIEGGSVSCTQNIPENEVTKFCGTQFSTTAMATTNAVVCDCVAPFQVGIFTDALNENNAATGSGATAAMQGRGNCLMWTQLPCSN